MQNIKISIIVPFYKTADYIEQTLSSFVSQVNFDLNTLEIIIVNDGDTYNLSAIINKYKKIINLSYYHKNNGNWSSVINFVKNNKIAKGEYLSVLDSDDYLKPNCLSLVSKHIDECSPDAIFSNFYCWDSLKNKKKVYRSIFHFNSRLFVINKQNKYKFNSPVSLPICKFYKTKLFYEINDLEENVSYQDIKLYFSLLKKLHTIYFINKKLGYWRHDRPDSSSNVEWTEKRLVQWINIIKFLDDIDCSLISVYYTLVRGFKKAYLQHYSAPIHLKHKIKNLYTSKCLWPLVKVFFLVLKVNNKKVFSFI